MELQYAIWERLKSSIYDSIHDYKFFQNTIYQINNYNNITLISRLDSDDSNDDSDTDDEKIIPSVSLIQDGKKIVVANIHIQNFLRYICSSKITPLNSDIYISYCLKHKINPLISKLLIKYNDLFRRSSSGIDTYCINFFIEIFQVSAISERKARKSIRHILSGIRILFQHLNEDEFDQFLQLNDPLCLIPTETIKQYEVYIIQSVCLSGDRSNKIKSPRKQIQLVRSVITLCQDIFKTIDYFGINEHKLNERILNVQSFDNILHSEYVQLCLILEESICEEIF